MCLEFCESETLVPSSSGDCLRLLWKQRHLSSPSNTKGGFNSAIIINDRPFAYPDCTFWREYKAEWSDKALVITNPIISTEILFVWKDRPYSCVFCVSASLPKKSQTLMYPLTLISSAFHTRTHYMIMITLMHSAAVGPGWFCNPWWKASSQFQTLHTAKIKVSLYITLISWHD